MALSTVEVVSSVRTMPTMMKATQNRAIIVVAAAVAGAVINAVRDVTTAI